MSTGCHRPVHFCSETPWSFDSGCPSVSLVPCDVHTLVFGQYRYSNRYNSPGVLYVDVLCPSPTTVHHLVGDVPGSRGDTCRTQSRRHPRTYLFPCRTAYRLEFLEVTRTPTPIPLPCFSSWTRLRVRTRQTTGTDTITTGLVLDVFRTVVVRPLSKDIGRTWTVTSLV